MATIKKVITGMSLAAKNANDKFRISSYTKESLTAQLEANRNQLNVVDAAIFRLNSGQLNRSYDKMLTNLKDPKVRAQVGPAAAKALNLLPKNLGPMGRSIGIFGVMQKSHKVMVKLNSDLLNNVDSVIGGGKYVSLKRTKLSHSLMLGVMEGSRVYARFNSYLVAVMSHINVGSADKLPRYVTKFLADNVDTYCKMIRQISSNSGRYSVINDITNLRHNSVDVEVFNESSAVQSRLITDVLGIENIFLDIFGTVGMVVGFFGEVAIDMQHNYYSGLNDQKKWMETHVSILEMDMAGMDPNDPEYIRMKKAADYYNDKIAGLDEQLDQYYKD